MLVICSIIFGQHVNVKVNLSVYFRRLNGNESLTRFVFLVHSPVHSRSDDRCISDSRCIVDIRSIPTMESFETHKLHQCHLIVSLNIRGLFVGSYFDSMAGQTIAMLCECLVILILHADVGSVFNLLDRERTSCLAGLRIALIFGCSFGCRTPLNQIAL